MINLILILVIGGAFYLGYKAGLKGSELSNKIDKRKKQFRNWVRDHT